MNQETNRGGDISILSGAGGLEAGFEPNASELVYNGAAVREPDGHAPPHRSESDDRFVPRLNHAVHSLVLAALPRFKCAGWPVPLPLVEPAVLVVEAEVPTGEPPLHSAADGGASAPAVGVAAALAVARVVHPLQKRSLHKRGA